MIIFVLKVNNGYNESIKILKESFKKDKNVLTNNIYMLYYIRKKPIKYNINREIIWTM